MLPKYTYEELIAKLVRAELLAQKLIPDKRHTSPCPREVIHPDELALCICGTDATLSAYKSLMKELKI